MSNVSSMPSQSPSLASVFSRRGLGVPRYLRNPLSVIGIGIFVVLIFAAVFAPAISPYNPRTTDLESQFLAPSREHLFGTDSAGSDVFSKVIYGARYALLSGVIVLGLSAGGGSLIGLVSGYFGGWVDEVIMRVTDMFLAFPGLILAMAVVGALERRGLVIIVVAIAIRWWAPYARLMRAQVLSLRSLDYVEAGRVAGGSSVHVMLRHILPNGLSPIIVQASLDLGYIILTEASLSFLGFGVPPGQPDWGRMVSDGREYMQSYWWIVTFPGIAIMLSVLAFNLIGDAARDMLDPKFRGESL